MRDSNLESMFVSLSLVVLATPCVIGPPIGPQPAESIRDFGFESGREPSPPRAFTPRGLDNVIAAARLLAYVRFFHPSDQAVAFHAWDHFAVNAEIWDVTTVKPENGADLVPGIVYFDLDGAEATALTELMPVLTGARGIVFDLRGYPNSAAFELVLHLIDGPATSAQWKIPIVTLPDHEGWDWATSGWQLEPTSPRIEAALAFPTDGRAISYAESIMDIVEHYHLGEIVGSTTAGTNGNVNPFELPGGFTVWWTGMKVLKHDGSRHHGVGIQPTIPVVPTAAGIADGSDEVLEKAVEVLAAEIRGEGR